MRPLLSIALITYNRPSFLKECIDSILNQSFKDFELIILDNGSTLSTYEVVKSFDDFRVKYLKNNQNSKNFINKAFTFTNLKYFMITHDDDIMMKNFLKRSIEFLDENENISLVASSVNLIDQDGKKLRKTRPRLLNDKRWTQYEFIKTYMFRGDIIPCPTIIFRSSLIKDYNLKYNWKVGPAVDLYMLFVINILKKQIYLLKEPLYNYRIHNYQDSNQNRLDLEFIVRPHIISLLNKSSLQKLAKRYEKASTGIILNILINDVITGKLKYNNALIYFDKLKNLKTSLINIYTVYWSLIGFLRGIKNKIS